MSATGRLKSVFRCAVTASTVSGGIVAEMCLTWWLGGSSLGIIYTCGSAEESPLWT